MCSISITCVDQNTLSLAVKSINTQWNTFSSAFWNETAYPGFVPFGGFALNSWECWKTKG